jgi:hypothetical protein
VIGTFDEAGIRFRYPENWKLEREDTEGGWTVSLQSPETAFVTIGLYQDGPDAMREDYPDLEAEDCVDSLAGRPAIGHDIRFFSLDLTNTCWIRSFYCSRGTVVVMCQVNDLELEKNEPVLRAICASLQVDDE